MRQVKNSFLTQAIHIGLVIIIALGILILYGKWRTLTFPERLNDLYSFITAGVQQALAFVRKFCIYFFFVIVLLYTIWRWPLNGDKRFLKGLCLTVLFLVLIKELTYITGSLLFNIIE